MVEVEVGGGLTGEVVVDAPPPSCHGRAQAWATGHHLGPCGCSPWTGTGDHLLLLVEVPLHRLGGELGMEGSVRRA